jgi:hypothetical protein
MPSGLTESAVVPGQLISTVMAGLDPANPLQQNGGRNPPFLLLGRYCESA